MKYIAYGTNGKNIELENFKVVKEVFGIETKEQMDKILDQGTAVRTGKHYYFLDILEEKR